LKGNDVDSGCLRLFGLALTALALVTFGMILALL
jgi:hypothetical protein